MSAQHTPGPWQVAYTHGGGTQIAIDDAFGLDGGRDYDLVTVTHGDPDVLEANARLIAAAPELLEALLAEVAVIEASGKKPMARTLAAIANATGSPA